MPTVELTKPDKVIFPAAGDHAAITKADMWEYATRVADRMVPWTQDRPAVLQRFPDGIDGDGWYQKHTPKHFPDWIPTVEVPKRGGTVRHPVVSSTDALRYVVNQGTVSVHLLGGSAASPGRPVDLVIDLDPSVDDPIQVVDAAAVVRELLTDLGTTPFVKTTGSRGVHVHVFLTGDAGFDAVRTLAQHLAAAAVERAPDLLTTEFAKADRGDRLFVDVLRNAPAQHAVAPYTLRPRPGAPVAVPLEWDELDRSWTPDATPLAALAGRLDGPDPWADAEQHRTDPAQLARALAALVAGR